MRTITSVVLLCGFLTGISAQQAPTTTPLTTVPRLVRISNSFHPANGLAASPTEGRYTTLRGATLNDGMPLELFTSGEPRWLGVQFQRTGEVEQARVLLTSVPYALKAVDADTLGGRPASAYLLSPAAETPGAAASAGAAPSAATVGGVKPKVSSQQVGGSGTAGFIPVFTDANDVGNSSMY